VARRADREGRGNRGSCCSTAHKGDALSPPVPIVETCGLPYGARVCSCRCLFAWPLWWQGPGFTKVTLEPLTVHTVLVVDANNHGQTRGGRCATPSGEVLKT
jgi:hypothetical protein